MSAGICVMNRNAAVLAADSAITIGNHLAVRNSGNKVFALSKTEPIGAIIYNELCFMSTPIEIILKEYKANSKDKNFDCLSDYLKDFFEFIELNSELFRLKRNEYPFILFSILNWIENFNRTCKNIIERAEADNITLPDEKLVKSRIMKLVIKNAKEDISKIDNLSFYHYVKDNFENDISEILSKYLSWCDNDLMKEVLEILLYIFDIPDDNILSYTGLLFCGYGRKEIFPSAVHFHLYGSLNGKLCYKIIENSSIQEDRLSSIIPVAQDDVMNTFIRGINDEMYRNFSSIGGEILESFDKISDSLFAPNKKNEVKDIINNTVANISAQLFVSAKDSSKSVENAMISLQIDEMIKFAESMINITSVRRLVLDNINGTVGGPVDIAVISKSDGFIWKQRKLYFDGKINPQYFYSHYLV